MLRWALYCLSGDMTHWLVLVWVPQWLAWMYRVFHVDSQPVSTKHHDPVILHNVTNKVIYHILSIFPNTAKSNCLFLFDQVFDEPMDPPTLNMPTEICIYMQSGLVKDSVKLDTEELTLKTLKEYACNFIDRKVSAWADDSHPDEIEFYFTAASVLSTRNF